MSLTTVTPQRHLYPHPAEERCPWCGHAISHQKFKEITTKIERQERTRYARLEQELRSRLQREFDARRKREIGRLQVENKKLKRESVQKEAAIRADEARKQKLARNNEMERERSAQRKQRANELAVQQRRFDNQILRLQRQVDDLQRRLERRSAHDQGDDAEIDLYRMLNNSFRGDDIQRVRKGVEGADIIHRVRDAGKVCGTIIYDSKSRARWARSYVTKLRDDRKRHEADHAILSTTVFPAGIQQLEIRDDIIITHPARVLAVAMMLREHVIRVHSLKLSREGREEKTAHLYEFITSETSRQLLDEIERATNEILGLDQKEKKAHETTWENRDKLIKRIQRAHGEFHGKINRILTVSV